MNRRQDIATGNAAHWNELETFCAHLENRRATKSGAEGMTRFASLYRAACADLALADSYRLPPATVQYLHQLVARAHNQLYRSRQFRVRDWLDNLMYDVPKRIYNDRCVQLSFVVFWAIFIGSAGLAANKEAWPEYVPAMISQDQIDMMESNFAEPFQGANARVSPTMTSFYIKHNMSIGLQCFVGGLFVIPGLLITLFNAAFLGGCFGYMARPEVAAGPNFFEFVVAHGPFELTAIVLSAAAGLRLGLSWIRSYGIVRIDALRQCAEEVMPLMGAALVMFLLAAIIEGCLSPSSAPFAIKAATGLLSSGLLTAYFIVLGYPRGEDDAV